MIRVLFVCHGNICRSPMAEIFTRDLARCRGLRIYLESAAVSREEIGNPVYPPARRELAAHGLKSDGHAARQVTDADYERFDLLVAMDSSNLRTLRHRYRGDPEGKLRLLLDYTSHPRDVADPWYTGDFRATWDDIVQGCTALLDQECAGQAGE